MSGEAGRRAGELSALSGKWLLCINWAACISWSYLLSIIFCNREISLVLHWAASLVGFGFLMSWTGALFLSIFCDGLGPGYSYYAPPLPLSHPPSSPLPFRHFFARRLKPVDIFAKLQLLR